MISVIAKKELYPIPLQINNQTFVLDRDMELYMYMQCYNNASYMHCCNIAFILQYNRFQ